MRSHSLRLRLLAGAGAWIAVALLLAGFAIVLIFTASVERDRRQDLLASLDRLLTSVSADGELSQLQPGLSDPRYGTPAGGLYWQVLDPATGETARSRSLWDTDLAVTPPATPSAPAAAVLAGPAGQTLDALTQDVALRGSDGTRQLRVTVAEDSAIRGRDIRSFALDIGGALLALGVALVLAGWLTVNLGLKPLSSVRGELEAVTAGRAQKLAGTYPQEVLPLVEEVNSLLAGHERSIAFARARADDLAHGLKTPLSVLKSLGTELADKGDPESARLVDEIATEMDDRVDYQLRLSRLRLRTRAHQLAASLNEAVDRTVAVLVRTRDGERLNWQVDLSPGLVVDIDRHDLTELVGVMLENAAKWGKSAVRVEGRAAGGTALLTIADDGPGLSEAEIARLGVRGQRLDETRRGSGLGVAIALEIVAINAGRASFGRAPEGGLSVELTLPLADTRPPGTG